MRTDLELLTIGPAATIRQGIAQIDQNRAGIIMITDAEGALLGTATDGDIRRAILANTSLDEPIASVMYSSPTVATLGMAQDELMSLMAPRCLRHLPVVDSDGVVCGLVSLDELLEVPNVPKLSAVVMAGGLGTRLRPYTDKVPKPLIPVGGKPILERIVEHLQGSGVEQLVITTRYMAEQVEGYFKDGQEFGVHIDYIREQERRGTAGALRDLVGKQQGPLLVMNGDLLTDFHVQQMFDFHREHNAVMTVGVRHYTFQVPYGVAQVDGVQIKALSEKPTYDFFVNAGIYILEPRLLELIPEHQYYDITELIDALVKRQERVISFPIHELWMDIGRPEDLERANELFEQAGVVASPKE